MRLPIAFCLLAAVVPTLAFAGEDTQPERTKVAFFLYPKEGEPKKDSLLMMQNYVLFDAVAEKYPDIELYYKESEFFLDNGQYDFSQLEDGIAAETLYLNCRTSYIYIEKNWIHPLDEYINLELTAKQARQQNVYNADIMYKDEFEDRVHPALLPVIFRAGPDGKKHVWALPYGCCVLSGIANKNLFRQAGLDPEKDLPETWEQFYAAAEKIDELGADISGYTGTSDAVSSWFAGPFLMSAGLEYSRLNPETGKMESAVSASGAEEGFDFYVQLLQRPRFSPVRNCTRLGVMNTGEDKFQAWKEGRIGMKFIYLDLSASPYGIASDQIIFPVPKAPNGRRVSEFNAACLGMYSRIKDKQTRDAAWRLIRFWGSKDSDRIRIDIGRKTDENFRISSAQAKRLGIDDPALVMSERDEKVYEIAFANGKPEWNGPGAGRSYFILSKVITDAVNSNIGLLPDKEKRLQWFHQRLKKLDEEINRVCFTQPKQEVF